MRSPYAAQSTRKAIGQDLRPRFREISELLKSLDRLVLRFRSTEAGERFAASWKNARQIRNLGRGAATATPQAVPVG